MALSIIPVENLVEGVSQAPADKRSPGQLEALENGLTSATHGLRKRPPSEPVGVISNDQTGFDNAWIHTVNRTPSERYTVVIVGGDLKVFDTITGAQHNVYFPDGKDYLAANSARGFRGWTVGDHTFIVNRNVIVKRGEKRSPSAKHEALLFVRQADYGTDYVVELEGHAAAHSTPLEVTPESRAEISTSRIAQSLYEKLRVLDEIKDLFDFTLMGSTIHVARKDGADFAVAVHDGLADKGLKLIKGSVKAIEDLPARARQGMLVKIEGDIDSKDDNTWVVYESGNDNDGIWRETTAPDVVLDLDASTMPHELVRQGRLTKTTALVDLQRKPLSAGINYGSWRRGWEFDTNDNPLAWPNVYMGETTLTANGSVSSGVLPGAHPTLPRKITVSYSLDVSSLHPNNTVEVALALFDGTSWYEMQTREHTTGGAYVNQTFTLSTLVTENTRVRLILRAPTYAMDGHTRKPRLTAHGTGANRFTNPGILVQAGQSTGIYTGHPWTVWPMGTSFSLVLNGKPFAVTLSQDMDTKQLNGLLAGLVNFDPTMVATYDASKNLGHIQLDWFEVQTNSGAPVTVDSLQATFDASKRAWNHNLSMNPGEYAGLTLRNLTDGSVATIVTNSKTAFEVNGLTGGKNNVFKSGDEIVVEASGNAYFVFQQAPWADRPVGDDHLNPLPSFVDRTINEVFFHAGRLGFTADDYAVLSSSDNVYRFTRSTVVQVLDTDPIDIQSAHEDVAVLDSAVEWEGELLLCSSSGQQFVLKGDPYITPATVRLEHLSSFPVSEKVRPVAMGSTVVLPRQAAGFTQVRQMYRTRDRGLETHLLTEAIPTYIPGDTIDLCGDTDHRFLAVLPDGGQRNEVYVFTWGQLDERTPQSAWSRWTFNGRVVGIDYYDGHLYLVIYRGTQVCLERINVADPSGADDIHLDRGSIPYIFKARLSRPFLRDRFTQRTITEGRTQLRTVELNFHDSGYFRVEVTPKNRPTKQYVVTAESGRKRIPVLAENKSVTIDIINDQPQGCAFTSLVYEVSHSRRSGREP